MGVGKLNTKRKVTPFEARMPHTTLEFDGPRITVTWYVHATCMWATSAVRSRLCGLGARFPTPEQLRSDSPEVVSMAVAKAQWRRYTGSGGNRHTPTQPNRLPGIHRTHAWRCKWCKVTGVQSVGRPRHFCSNLCAMKHKCKTAA